MFFFLIIEDIFKLGVVVPAYQRVHFLEMSLFFFFNLLYLFLLEIES